MKLLAVLVVLLIALTACVGGDDDDSTDDAGAAVVEQFDMAIRGQWGRVWDLLHPEHQAIVSRDFYAQCLRSETFPDYDISADEVFTETIAVPELGDVETTAVTLRFENEDGSEFLTRHVIDVDGEWRWILNEEAISAVESGECP